MEVGVREGVTFSFSAMLDRVDHPARGRRGGAEGAPTTIVRDDGTAMHGKGKQFVPHGACVQMAFPGGAGYGPADARDPDAVRRDLALGYISAETAATTYGLDPAEIDDILVRAKRGEAF